MEYEIKREVITQLVNELLPLVRKHESNYLNLVYGLVETAGRVVGHNAPSTLGAAELTRLLQEHLSNTVALGMKVRNMPGQLEVVQH